MGNRRKDDCEEGCRHTAYSPNDARIGQGPFLPEAHSPISRSRASRALFNSAIRSLSAVRRALAASRARSLSSLASRSSSSLISSSVKPADCACLMNRSLRTADGSH